jgi:hypothetical protein
VNELLAAPCPQSMWLAFGVRARLRDLVHPPGRLLPLGRA